MGPKVLSYVSCGLSLSSLLITFVFLPAFINKVSQIHMDLEGDKRQLRSLESEAWGKMMKLRTSLGGRPKRAAATALAALMQYDGNTFNVPYVSARGDTFYPNPLPSPPVQSFGGSGYCRSFIGLDSVSIRVAECDAFGSCPAGAKGARGAPGLDGGTGQPGVRGQRGRPGQGNSFQAPAPNPGCCKPANPGRPGTPGTPGRPGPDGNPGGRGPSGNPGRAGGSSTRGPPGPPGTPGNRGQNGQPGRDGTRPTKGTPGTPGRAGGKGNRGPPGQPGRAGTPGSGGTPGRPGRAGTPGAPGPPGAPGEGSRPGNDSGYCPCPRRSRFFN